LNKRQLLQPMTMETALPVKTRLVFVLGNLSNSSHQLNSNSLGSIVGILHITPKVLYSFYYQNFDRNYFVTAKYRVYYTQI